VARRTIIQRSGFIDMSDRQGRGVVRGRLRRKQSHQGFTVVELMITVAIMGILASFAGLAFAAYREKVQVSRVVEDIRAIQDAITTFQILEGRLPADLAEVRCDSLRDAWGNPYQYTNFETEPKGKWRKDKFLVPINSAYDLWSMGPDGRSVPPLTAKFSHDDIIRANDGLFIGKATRY
jgi:general secretion pathway protein G